MFKFNNSKIELLENEIIYYNLFGLEYTMYVLN